MTKLEKRQLGVVAAANIVFGAFVFGFGALLTLASASSIALDGGPNDIVVFGQGMSVATFAFALMGAAGLLNGVLSIAAGNRIIKRRSRVFCILVSVLNALSVPIGTLIGVVTIVLLMRPSVVEAFDDSSESMDASQPSEPLKAS